MRGVDNQLRIINNDHRSLDVKFERFTMNYKHPRDKCPAGQSLSYAVVPLQVAGCLRPTSASQMRGDYETAHIAGDARRDHVSRNKISATDAVLAIIFGESLCGP
jgi:hypothetical protein